MNICLLGATGMLGQELMDALGDHHLIPYSSKDCDMTDLKAMEKVLMDTSCDVFVNSAAYTKVDDAETHPDLAMQINGEAVGVLAEIAKRKGARLFHYSTDYVFNGQEQAGYSEDAKRDPINVYGVSKAKGEEYIQQVGGNSYIIRTAWLYGRHGANFVETMLKLGAERDALSVVNDQWGCPTWAKDLATYTKTLMEVGYDPAIYHGVNSGQTSWFHFAEEIFRIAELAVDLSPTTSASYSRPAPRPEFSILQNNRGPQMRPWLEALEQYLDQRASTL